MCARCPGLLQIPRTDKIERGSKDGKEGKLVSTRIFKQQVLRYLYISFLLVFVNVSVIIW
jgi:hypothetical protein